MKSIKKNATGKLVSFLKKNLIKLGYSVDATDLFDDAVDTAVKEYQTQKQLKVDGIVGKDTWTAIYIDTVAPRTSGSKLDRGDNVLLLHPVVRKAVIATYVQLQSEDIPFRIFEAFRTPDRQADLYAQGRTKPGNIVTYAQAWSSYHQYGLAVDFVLFIDGKWSWEDNTTQKRQWWKKLHTIGENEGLMRLDFETPHLQLAGTSSSALRAGLYPANGDSSWKNNLNTAISQWNKTPAAPPKVP